MINIIFPLCCVEADRKGVVYAKWYPKLSNVSDIDSKEWEAILDVENSNTYVSEKE